MNRIALNVLGGIALLVPAAASAQTSLLTTDAGYTGPGLNLSAFANGSYNFTFGPIVVDQYTFVGAPGGGGNSGNGSVVGQGGYGLGNNGSFGGDAVYIGVDSSTGYGQLTLNGGPVSQLGFFMNYCPNCGGRNATIEALDSIGNVFASYDIQTLAPISTPGGYNEFAFRGIASETANIFGLRFGGNYILVTGTADGVPTGGVPEPATWAMLLLGFALVGGALRARKQPVRVRYAF